MTKYQIEPSWNCYIAVIEPTQKEAESFFERLLGEPPLELVHKEPGNEPGENPIWVFKFMDEVLDESEEPEWLWDSFELPSLPNRPIAWLNG